MAVLVLEGRDGTSALYDSVTGILVGRIFPDVEQAESFLAWIESGGWLDHPAFRVYETSGLRVWAPHEVAALRVWWAQECLDDDGELLNPYECQCGPGHTHLGEHGATARGAAAQECSDPACRCSEWKPANKAAAAAARRELSEGE